MDASPIRLSEGDLATRAGVPVERIRDLAALGVLHPAPDGTFAPGEVHVLRLVEAFETSGVPIDALVAGMASGRLDFAGYHELHRDPGPSSTRTYGEVRASLDPGGTRLTALYTALGIAEPHDDVHLAAVDETRLVTWLDRLASVDDADLLVRVIRLHGEAARRTSAAALDVYEEAAGRLAPDAGSIDLEAYAQLLAPWSRIARDLPDLAAWLTERHLRDAIDAFSVQTSEQILAADGIVRARSVAPPGIAFVDLTGYTQTTRQLGDEVAAARSLRLGELARAAVDGRGGRLVKLLGDGALLWLPDALAAVDACVELLGTIVAAGLGGSHAGVHSGPVVEREGDIYGTAVNTAARIADHARDGEIEVSAEVADQLAAAGRRCEPLGTVALQGLGDVDLFRVVTEVGTS